MQDDQQCALMAAGQERDLEVQPSLRVEPISMMQIEAREFIASCEIKRVEITHRQTIPISLPVHAGQTNVFRLHSNGGGKPIAGDSRILNFRVFHIGPGA